MNVSVRLTDPKVSLWDRETGIRITSRGCFDAKGKVLSEIPETYFIRGKVKEGLLQIVEDAPEAPAPDSYNALRDKAKELGLEVPRGTKKDQLVAMIAEEEAKQNAPADAGKPQEGSDGQGQDDDTPGDANASQTAPSGSEGQA